MLKRLKKYECGARNRNGPRTNSETTNRVGARALSFTTFLAVGAALLYEFSVVSRAVSDFIQVERLEQVRIAHDGQLTPDERLNPAYLKRYGLDPTRYADRHAQFSPTGADWQRWSLRTKAAAIVMWLGHDPPGIWWTLSQIRCVDRVPEAHADTERIVAVADACLGEPHGLAQCKII
ncbi:hypothetical protein [Paraburkholderia sp. LEh10]|uniref:hypothetical protein n=1 Tax=Paraburkholderia sp. LEh10 TaxID=2821353 RepID=UPI001FD7E898|nr:hypothetical protein [Paraburkholderia sp. LEh10]